MYRWTLFLFLFYLILPYQTLQAQDQSRQVIQIGLIYDGPGVGTDALSGILRDELTRLLGVEYNIQLPDDLILDGGWSTETISAHYDTLTANENVDVIVGLGVLTSTSIAGRTPYPKPVILVGIFEPELQGLPPVVDNKSGVPDLTYILFNQSIERDLNAFYEIYPYQKVGIVFYNEIVNLISQDLTIFQNVVTQNNTSFELLPITDQVEDAFLSQDIDALYVGYLGPFEGDRKGLFIDAINDRQLPSFGTSKADVERGLLAAIAPDGNFPQIMRRIALNTESILSGEDAANLPVHISFEENLILNMETANKIGFSPKFTILSKAEVINEFAQGSDRVVNLLTVMREASQANLDVIIEERTVQSTQKDVSLARTGFFPALNLGASGTQIDQDRAAGSFGQQAERTTSGSASVEQLLFSEQTISNLTTRKHLLNASEYGYDMVKLDIVLEAAIAYFNVLRAEVGRKIQQDNSALTKRNLEIAKQREAVGYSGRSDVYRWESRLATIARDLIEAKNQVTLAKIQLNQLLNHPIDGSFVVQDISLSDGIYTSYLDNAGDYIDNPKSLDIFTNFLVLEAFRNSPEIQQVDANSSALHRTHKSFQLRRFVPNIGVGIGLDHIFSRTGAGSNVAGVNPVDTPWSLGINVTLPIFQGGAITANRQQTSIEIDKLDAQRSRLIQFLELNVRTAILELIVNSVNLTSSREAAELARLSLELVQDEYAQGRVTIVDLQDAQNTLLNANLAALNSEYLFLTSLLKTERATGKFTLLSPPTEQTDFFERFKVYFDQQNQTSR